MKLYARLVVALGFPIAAVCTLSLPLILLGAVAPDPRPWNWPTVYIVDFLYGLALFSQLVGFLCRRPHWRRCLICSACSQPPLPQNGSFSSSCPPG